MKNKIYYADVKFSDEFFKVVNRQKKVYPVGTAIICKDRICICRIRGGFSNPCPMGLTYLIK